MFTRTFTTDRGDAGRRLDLALRRHLNDVPHATRTRVQAWIEAGHVQINGTAVQRTSTRVAAGDVLSIALAGVAERRVMAAEDIALAVLYEDEHLLAIDKPPGVVVHPTYKRADGTILNALLWRARAWPAGRRPSIVGRLDLLTSGIVLVAKSPSVHAALQRALTAKESEKIYLAIVYGRVHVARGRIEAPLAVDGDRRRMVVSESGAPSLTQFERMARVPAPRAGLAALRCRLLTGRRHQIRVHLASRGWPIVGDPQYGEPRWEKVVDRDLASRLRAFPRQALHAWTLRVRHPATREILSIEAPIPADMQELLTAAGLAAVV
jgi:23S rRNA pseudouridine1911/1915/1917 synthase